MMFKEEINNLYESKYYLMAGAAGFEPANADSKNRCLTAWRRPNKLCYEALIPSSLIVFNTFSLFLNTKTLSNITTIKDKKNKLSEHK